MNERTHLIKYPGEFQEGDVIIHNDKKYRVSQYFQGRGMGHFLFGEYGTLYVQEINKPVWYDLWRNIAKTEQKEVVRSKKEKINTYEKYPFVVELPPMKEKQS